MKGFTLSNRWPDVVTAVQFSSMEPFATSHLWNFGDGTTSTQANPVKVYATPGMYDVTYTASNSLGSRQYKERRAVTVFPDRTRTPYLTINMSTLAHSTDLSSVPAGSLIKLVGNYSGDRRYFRFLNATKENPIHFINEGKITFTLGTSFNRVEALLFEDCKGFIFDMKADPAHEFGMTIENGGLQIQKVSSEFGIAGVQINNASSSSFKFKDSDLMRADHPAIFEDVWATGNDSNYAGNEGWYVGHFAYEQYRHTVKRCKLYRNTVQFSGWDGMQLANGDEASEVHDNVVTGCGTKKQATQESGMSINSGFTGEVYNNKLIEVNTCGGRMQVHPYSHTKLYNNVFKGINNAAPIFFRVIGNDSTAPFIHTLPGLNVSVFNNTVWVQTEAVRTTQFTINGQDIPVRIELLRIQNNILIRPDGSSINITRHTNLTPIGELIEGNVIATEAGASLGTDFMPTSSSPALNAGVNLNTLMDSTYLGRYDLDGRQRTANHAGAVMYATRLFNDGQGGEPEQPPMEEPQEPGNSGANPKILLFY
jgi:hypothetical protein